MRKVNFEEKTMMEFMKVDPLIRFMVTDLIQRGHEKEYALRIVFTSEIEGESEMEQAYRNVGNES